MNQASEKVGTHHEPAGPPPNDLNVRWTVVVGFVGAIAVFLFIVLVQIYFQKAERRAHYEQVVSEVPAQLVQLRSQQIERIHSYRLVDEKQQRVAIPVERAMELIARDPGLLATLTAPASASAPAEDSLATPDGGVK